jgi:hypothetical protein
MLLLLASSCKIKVFNNNDDESEFTGPSWSVGYFQDEDDQNEFLKRLDEEKIPFRHGNRNSIQVPVAFIARVRAIQRKIWYGDKLDPYVYESVIVFKATKENYEAAFKEKGIPYSFEKINGTHEAWSMHYSQYFGPQVDQIKQQLEIENRQY